MKDLKNKIDETLDALRLGVCSLVYAKIDGEIRTATGTLDPHLIPGEFHPKSKIVDMTGEVCYTCDGQGTFQETNEYDNSDGVLHCTNCALQICRRVKETPFKVQGELVHYFDLGTKGWRCFRLENLKSLSVQI